MFQGSNSSTCLTWMVGDRCQYLPQIALWIFWIEAIQPFSLAVSISEYAGAARSPPEFDPANSHFFCPDTSAASTTRWR
jgi:hypothetical protein